MEKTRIYNGVQLHGLDKNIKMAHSIIEKDNNVDFIDKVLDINKKLLSNELFHVLSALCSVRHLDYQVCNGGITQYYMNGYHEAREPYNEDDVARLDQEEQVEMLKILHEFGESVFPECEEDNNRLYEVIEMLEEMEYEENVPIYGMIDCGYDEY